MLRKLLKHEWIATGRMYGIFFLVLAAVTLVTKLMGLIQIDSFVLSVVKGIFTGIYVVTLIGVWFCSIGYAVVRFYKNMVSSEGYLTFTLPAKVEQLVTAKFLVAFVWQIVTIVALILSLCFVFVVGKVSMDEISYVWDAITSELGGAYIPAILFLIVVNMAYQLVIYYLSIAIGQLFTGNKIVGAVVGYCIIYFVVQALFIAMFVIAGAIGGFDTIDTMFNTVDGMPALFVVSSLPSLVFGVVGYFVTCKLLKKKLNLA